MVVVLFMYQRGATEWKDISILRWAQPIYHYDDVIMGAMASQTTNLTIVYSTIYSDADQRKHQSSA